MTTSKPPTTFISLDDAERRVHQSPYNVMAVCVDHLPAAKSSGSDFTMTLTLHDSSWSQGLGMKFRLFNASADKLPNIQSNGDVVILRNVITKVFRNQPLGSSSHQTKWAVLSGPSVMESTCPNGSDIKFIASGLGLNRAPSPSADEFRYAKKLMKSEDTASFRPPPKSTALDIEARMKAAGGTAPQRKEKWRLIKDLKPHPESGRNNFADLFGEVRKSWVNEYGRVELSMTDYTTNDLLYDFSREAQSRDGDVYGYAGHLHEKWPGPWGRMTITVLLYDAHAEYARSHVREGMFVLLKNCHIKLDPNHTKLEAACRGDREDVSKVNVVIYNPYQARGDDRFEGLLKRRLEYDKHATKHGIPFGFDRTTRKESSKRSIEDTNGGEEAVTTNSKANDKDSARLSKSTQRRKKRKKQLGNNKATAQGPSIPAVSQSNQHVRCLKIDVPVKNIKDILDPDMLKRKTSKERDFELPYQNCCYKAKVRIVDYYPNDIVDFAVPRLVSEYDALSDYEEFNDSSQALSAAQSNPHSVRWEWRFFLVVEDAGPQIPRPGLAKKQMALLVAGKDGEYLLNKEARDLRANPQELAKLRERLFIIWGDLQEKKEDTKSRSGSSDLTTQSRPFQCFIKEYGVALPQQVVEANGGSGHQRMFRLFGTTIS